MTEVVPPTDEALLEALALAEEILRGIELSQISLTVAALKASRLARLLNDFEFQRIFEYEASGYPTSTTGIAADVWQLGVTANRKHSQPSADGEWKDLLYTESIERLEAEYAAAKVALSAAFSVGAATDSLQRMFDRQAAERNNQELAGRISARRALLHQYAVARFYELKFSGIASDLFARHRERLEGVIWKVVPSAVQKFVAVHENLRSTNPEDWANAVHSCRRIVQDVADAVFPPQADRTINGKVVKLGRDNYINRLVTYIQENSTSDKFINIVGSHISYIGERLDAVFAAAQKGSHAEVSKEDADRFVIYTYMTVGDILSLWAPTA
jgi:hypothetical protein